MTASRDLKTIIRERQQKTGESYTAARAHVMLERARLLGRAPDRAEAAATVRADAVVLKLNQQSARVRILGEQGQVTFRSGDLWQSVPGHLVTLVIERQWEWRGDAYASGRIEQPRIDVAKLGLEPLPLTGGELIDVAAESDPVRRPDPYAPLWKRFTAKPRAAFEFDGIAWGALPGLDSEDNATCDAAELREAGDDEGARELLMDLLGAELRCVDAHAHLGNMVFDRSPERALAHYQVGKEIAELSLPPGFDGLLPWGMIYNRPYLRCLHGYGLCLWRLGKRAEARRIFEEILSLNPNDNQGARFCWDDVRRGRTWQEAEEQEALL